MAPRVVLLRRANSVAIGCKADLRAASFTATFCLPGAKRNEIRIAHFQSIAPNKQQPRPLQQK
jgi:hypothetical protein